MIVAGVLTLLNATTSVDLAPSTIITSVLAVVGSGLLVSAWMGRARGLVLLGLALIPVVAISTVADRIDLHGGFGEREYVPTQMSEIQRYHRLGAGSQTLDLTQVSVAAGQEPPHVVMSQGAGRIQLFVPESWNVDADVNVDIGEFDVDENRRDRVVAPDDPANVPAQKIGPEPTSQRDGLGVDRKVVLPGDPTAPTLDIHFDLSVGRVEVHRERP